MRSRLLFLAILALVIFSFGFLAGSCSREQPAPPGEGVPAPEPEGAAPTKPPPAGPPRGAEPPPGPAGSAVPPPRPREGPARVALVIDDLGRSFEELTSLEALGVPLSWAVLPFESRTSEVAAEIKRRGHELLCHLPMEAKNGENPGPGALRSAMSGPELAEATRKAIAAVPGAVGVNNHMGSGLTADRERMAAVLAAIRANELFFLDSRTSAESVGYAVAIELGMPAAERQVFLDPDPAPEAIRAQFERLLSLARERGAAIAIGHPYPSTLAVLAEEVPRARAAGYEFVPVSYLLDSPGELAE